ncbi:MAG TPA: hypothetical protein VEX60_05915 [Pyrinomonadaceae bacterium]|nr:hypothetical protein [Pyrinomonadaceae bacterium]
MRPLSAAELLSVWERGAAQQSAQRALALLVASCPDAVPDELAALSIGGRDARLLLLREWTFGPQLSGLAVCPGCGERLELDLDVGDLRVADAAESAEEFSLSAAGFDVRFRLPNSRDLIALARVGGAAGGRCRLLERCLLSAARDGAECEACELPADVLDAVADEMGRADPQADVQLSLSCPDCGHRWEMPFDIVSYFWGELHAWAQRTLREVHTLAVAYGWREADILAMSPLRREIYLQMVGG